MGPFGSGSLGRRTARGDRAGRLSAALLAAFVWIALAAPLQAPAQDQPWDIEGIQRRLVELGYEAGEVDGLLGPQTRAAIRAFQADRGLPVNGLPDGRTQDALFSLQPPDSATEAAGPNDDPPSLEAVPLEPVAVVQLIPLGTPSPHEGFSVDWPVAEAPHGTAPSESTAVSLASAEEAEAAETAQTKPRKKWLTWSAAALGGFGLVLLFAALRGRSRKREPATAEPPRPEKTPHPVAVAHPETNAPSGVGHVFGVDVPHPLRHSEPGARGPSGSRGAG